MSNVPEGYTADDVEQHRLGAASSPDELDVRTAFQHDVDRLLYASSFRALAGKTQVVSTQELGTFHNRLTHSLKVAQMGRRIAERLKLQCGSGPDPDLVEAACLAHDLGHPPFGHAGEEALKEEYDRLQFSEHAPTPTQVADGFQGNAQNLRIIGSIASRKTASHPGLHLTRATMDAFIKYPWQRTPKAVSEKGYESWGCYPEDVLELTWVLKRKPFEAPKSKLDVPPRPVEEQIMDWADDVTYACHDVEDFFRNGFIPLHLILRFGPADTRRRVEVEPYEAASFLDYVEKKRNAEIKPGDKGFDRQQAINDLRLVEELAILPGPYDGSHATKVLATSMTSRLIRFFMDGLKLEATSTEAAHLTRYGANLVVPKDQRRICELLKELIWYHVIDRPGLASQQHGQRQVVRKLLRWHAEDHTRLLPMDRLREVEEGHGSVLRAACDHVASMTERQAHALYQRMAGTDPGSITDSFL